MYKFLLLALSACLYSGLTWADDVAVSDAWARATAPGQDSAAVAMHITSKKDAEIIAVSSSVSGKAEIHSMIHENGMMKMRAMDVLPLKAGQEVLLGSAGNHLMLMNLKQPLKAGDKISLMLSLRFADKHQEKITVQAEVRPLTEAHDRAMHMDHMHMNMN